MTSPAPWHLGLGATLIAALFALLFTSSAAFSQDNSSHIIDSRFTETGSYLAARYAQHNKDWNTATAFFEEASSQNALDPNMHDTAFILALGAGRYDYANQLAQHPATLGPEVAAVGVLMRGLDALKKKDYKTATARFKNLPATGVNAYLRALSLAWVTAETDDLNASLQALSALPKSASGDINPLFHITAGMLSEYKGNIPSAKLAYDQAAESFLTLPSAMMVGGFYTRSHDFAQAENIFETITQNKPHMNGSFHALKQAQDGTFIENDINSVEKGLSRALHNFASFLYEQKGYEGALIYARIADYLAPNNPHTDLLLGDLMVVFRHYDAAKALYAAIAPAADNYVMAQMRLAETMERDYDFDGAITTLSPLLGDGANDVELLIRMGDINRRAGNHKNAIDFYNRAETQQRQTAEDAAFDDWNTLYSRAISYDALGEWKQAEGDLTRALELNPDHPLILNFLGYNWADRGENLPQAYEMIEKASILKPDSGYILDSLGWVLYKMEHYQEAIAMLESAVELVPYDEDVNEHLGDAYWKVGRTTEAVYQWNKAIDTSSNENYIYRLRAKIKSGLNGERETTTAAQ